MAEEWELSDDEIDEMRSHRGQDWTDPHWCYTVAAAARRKLLEWLIANDLFATYRVGTDHYRMPNEVFRAHGLPEGE